MSQIDKDFNCFKSLSDEVALWCSDFQQGLDERPVAVMDSPTPPESDLPVQGAGAKEALNEFVAHIAPGLSGSAGPRYLGFITGGVTPAAMLGDWLVSATDQNVMVPGDSISSAVETQTLEWLCQLFALPNSFTGTLTTGATSANILGLICGRQYAGMQQELDIAKDGMGLVDIEVFSACPHASSQKALSFIGLGREAVIPVPCLPGTEAMNVEALAAMLEASNSPGKIVIASAGTVTGTDFDDLQGIAELCQQHQAWLHVDATFGIFSRLSPERIYLTKGIEYADSISCDGHKWLNVPYDCGIFLTRHATLLQQVCSVAAPYLDISDTLPAFMDRGIENSRRFRALPVWLSLKAYGREGYRTLVEDNCKQASKLASWIEHSVDYELLAPCHLNVVVFAPAEKGSNVPAVLERINRSGKVYLTPGQWQGKPCIRAAFSNWRTTLADVEIVCKALTAAV